MLDQVALSYAWYWFMKRKKVALFTTGLHVVCVLLIVSPLVAICLSEICDVTIFGHIHLSFEVVADCVVTC